VTVANAATTLTWQQALAEEKQQPYFKELLTKLNDAYQSGKTIYPPKKDIFNAIALCPLDKVKVVIVGQDPYHGPGQAMGLSFSVPNGVRLPPSLQNIYKEICSEFDCPMPTNGDLTHWAEQGVLLLNATLTVERANANSHAQWGWQQFTDKIIHLLNDAEQPIVFLLWGSFAAKKCACINNPKHLILKAPHPSPLSAYRGFIGCEHFSKANAFLQQHNREPIHWVNC
jgi:uracil-DNA glycosylase